MAGKQADVLVIGGGVAGLAAAAELARRKRRVILLEARERLGGRILTAQPTGWKRPIELGAEFIHEGNPPLWRIVRENRLAARPMPSRHWHFRRGQLVRMDDLAERIERVTGRIDRKRVGKKSFGQFLREQRREISADDADVAAGFVEGFEAAPMNAMSARALAGVTLDDETQFFLRDGYQALIVAMVAALPRDRVELILRAPVRTVDWRRGEVVVGTTGGKRYVGSAAVITLPLGVLQASWKKRGAVQFRPSLRAKEKVWRDMRMGQVVRLVIRFDPRRWRQLLPAELRRGKTARLGFIHSRLPGVPVWWSLHGDSIVTGWAGGPAALALSDRSRAQILERAIAALAQLLGASRKAVRAAIAGWEMHPWSRDPFSRGAYTFTAAGQDDAPAKLRQPVKGTLYFAGEATADGDETGTVHGALASGLRAARAVAKKR